MKKVYRHTGPLLAVTALAALLTAQSASAALALDRTRVVLNGDENSVSLNVNNDNTQLPFLAQAWVEDAAGNKISDPLVALPPVQRIEPGAKSQIKVQSTGGISRLPQDRESLFYFNLREIPPRSDKPNTLQIALQSRIKLFWRPAALKAGPGTEPWQKKLTLTRQGDHYVAGNPTPYFITISDISSRDGGAGVSGFEPVMLPPRGSAPLKGAAASLGESPVLTVINDYGGHPKLVFSCSGGRCQVKSMKDD
ncbi:fimbria/pilus periplasmic chaperone [Cedecea sp. NFIX57]|uniref:fimbria/pilus periplasmic chaperone n=1 Tax=Cedecea sp. NFIX57 TaxID=1566286 RepID=UPI000A0A9FF4|nr:fimbria/pilus periplasmic chaperone [Cedecea sp. NFIX57]SMG61776.1 P pilus assembly protein, chaperone PapD [Cedecea sp. NFIX57]